MLFNDPRQLSPKVMTAILRDSGALWERGSVSDVRLRNSEKTDDMMIYHIALRYMDVRNIRTAPTMVMLCVTKKGDTRAKNEVKFYETFAPSILKAVVKPEKTALLTCYDAYYDDDHEQAHLLFNDVSDKFFPSRDGQPPSKLHKERVMDMLAQHHAFWWADEKFSDAPYQVDEAILDNRLETSKQAYAKFAQYMGRSLNDKQRSLVEKVCTTLPDFRREQLLSGNQTTLLHGRTRPTDFLYSHNDIRVRRWQHWRTGIGTDDLAYLIAAHFPFPVRKFEQKRLLERYFNSLRMNGVKDYTWDALQRDYSASVAHTIATLVQDWAETTVTDNQWATGKLALQTFEDINGMAIYD
ncbi:MAG: hypothetical protein ACPG7F_17205 [Aggregatilineales bacterium]